MNTQELVLKYYKEDLSAYRLIYSKMVTTYLFLTGIPVFCIGIYFFIRNPNVSNNDLWGVACVIYFYMFTLLLDSGAKKYVRKNFHDSTKTISPLGYAIKAEQKRLLKIELKNSGYKSSENVDDLINMYDNKNEKSKLERLLPFSILVLFWLPIWNEYVGFRFSGLLREIQDKSVYTEAFNLVWRLMAIGAVLWLFVFLVVKMIRLIFLNSNNRVENLCDILKEISHELKKVGK
ncbi:hypothetical protein DFQ01_109128 [Paenibacillus cellulosilyticus]|uniref:Uncharacterized protein n=1 Tax=Paenibacillus cellulosilyticus TaxID=375489 RepID=A0A2V2YSZ7_9BACL|nr:hypothetical protein [Paenibacillus cellulosilyticus]PWW02503.1 hypothetical protein DFQ01_109128 [Paenibacillus cellulosilyticus]QKS47205.1 hypothetical protein HUB94_22455 [Paenibacillus cellulosilyticus]